LESITVIHKRRKFLRVKIWWKKLFLSRKRKRHRRRSEILCLWKEMTYVLGMS
jgi:hypothetical protein